GINTAVPGNLTVGDSVGTAGTAIVKLLQSTEIANASNVTVNSDGKFDLNSFTDVVGGLTINSGSVSIGTGQLTVSSVGMTGGSVSSTGAGKLSLSGNITATSGAGTGAT